MKNKRQASWDVLEAEKELLRGDYGLDIEASYLQNFKAGFFDAAGIFYRNRARFGIEWNILNNGLVENLHDLQNIEKEQQALMGESDQEISDLYFDELKKRVRSIFSYKKREVLQSYLDLLSSQEKIQIGLYHQNYVTWDEVLAVTSEKARIDRLLKSATEISEKLSEYLPDRITVSDLPVMELNLDMFERLASQHAASEGNEVSGAIDEYHPIDDITLSASVDYNYFSNAPEESFTGTDNQREFISVSVNLSVPFPLQVKENNDLEEAQRRELEHDLSERKTVNSAKVFKIYEEHQRLLAEYERDFNSYKQYEQIIENLQTKKQMGDSEYSPQELLNTLQNRYAKIIEMLEGHQQILEKLVEAHEITYRYPVRQFIEPVSFEYDSKNKVQAIMPNAYRRSIYIWSDDFESYSNEAIVEYLTNQNFDTVFLSAGVQPEKKKLKAFVELANDAALSVELLVGDNNLMATDNQQKIEEYVQLATSIGTSGIHLDVEPQTFADWDQNKKNYLDQYLKMATKAHRIARRQNLRLSLSIPVYFDSIIDSLSKKADNIQLMAYGTTDVSLIEERVEQELNTSNSKMSIAIRPQDFANYPEMKRFLQQWEKKGLVERYGIHDLSELINSQDAILKSIDK